MDHIRQLRQGLLARLIKISDEEGLPGNLIPTSIVLGKFNIFAKFGIWKCIIHITKL